MTTQDINFAIRYAANQENIHDEDVINDLIHRFYSNQPAINPIISAIINTMNTMNTVVNNNAAELMIHLHEIDGHLGNGTGFADDGFIINMGGIAPIFPNNLMENVKKTLVPDDFNKLQKVPYNKLYKKDDNCAICLDKFEDDAKNEPNFIQLPCEHEFHVDCIKPHLQSCDYRCPICRKECGAYKCDV